jgi:hypothetical protein
MLETMLVKLPGRLLEIPGDLYDEAPAVGVALLVEVAIRPTNETAA